MPLVSSREAAQKRAERAAADAREQRRRDRSSSLPMTIESSTKATNEKAMRRRSTRRESIASFKEKARAIRNTIKKENTPPRRLPFASTYSPPLTRSAKKARFDGDDTQSLVLNFSPPDQQENARREEKEKDMREMARNRRIQKARAAGELMEFSNNLSPSGRQVAVPKSTSSNSTASGLTEPQPDPQSMADTAEMKTMLEQMNTRISELASGKDQSSESLQLQKERHNELVAANNELKETNKGLESKMQELAEESRHTKELFLVEKTKLQGQLEAEQDQSRKTIESMQQASGMLQEQVGQLTEDKQQLKETIIGLEKDLEATQDKLQSYKEQLEVMSMRAKQDEQTHHARCMELESMNRDLQTELADRKDSEKELERDVALLEQAVEELESKLEATDKDLKQARANLDQKEADMEEMKAENSDLQSRVSEFQNAVQELQNENGSQSQKLEQVSQECADEIEELSTAVQEKDHKIGELFKKLGDLQQELREERASAAEQLDMVEKAKSELAAQVEQLNTALEETMQQVDSLEASNKEMKSELVKKQRELEESKVALDAMEVETSEMNQQQTLEIEELNKALLDSMGQIETFESENAELKNDLAQTKEALLETEKVKESLEQESGSEVKKLTSELEEAAMEIEAGGKELAEAKMEIEEFAEAEKTERSKREAAERRVQELERALKATTEERNQARSNMSGFDEREEQLYNKIRELDHIRRVQHGKIMQLMGNIRVFVRVRPALEGEAEAAAKAQTRRMSVQKRKREDEPEISPFHFPEVGDGSSGSSSLDASKQRIRIREPAKDRGGLSARAKTWDYAFDNVFTPEHGQEDVWESTEPMVQCAVDGYNVTVFAYGQTASGKTHTMLGKEGDEGIIARAVKKLFGAKSEMEGLPRGASKVTISVELLEVYNEKVRDLLNQQTGPNGKEIEITVTSKKVVGNIVCQTSSEEEVLAILKDAQKRRCVKATGSNDESSRSHMLFTIHFDVEMSDGTVRNGKLNVCDLAGSERLDKSGTNAVGGALLKETQNINKSLCVLSNVIERLQAGDKNIPFRESKLTFLLKDSLSGNSKTLAIVCCNPLSVHMQESLGSLRFASKVNRVDLKAVANFSC